MGGMFLCYALLRGGRPRRIGRGRLRWVLGVSWCGMSMAIAQEGR